MRMHELCQVMHGTTQAWVVPCMNAACVGTLGAVLTDAMVTGVLPHFAHYVCAKLAGFGQLRDGLSFQDRRCVECVADVTAGAWLDAMPAAFNRVPGDGVVVLSLRSIIGVCPAAMQDNPFVCECYKKAHRRNVVCAV